MQTCFQEQQGKASGADPGLSIEGAQKTMCTQRTFQRRSVKSIAVGVQGPGSFRVLDALSWYLSLILMHSDTKMGKKNIVNQNLEGARACCTPLWIRH